MNTWNIDKAHSEIGFKVKHLMVSTVRGHFTDFDGQITLPDQDLTKASITFTAETSSINTNNEMRDNHLKSADFFNSNEFPTLSFKSNTINKKSKSEFNVTGELTIRDISKEISLDVVFNGTTVSASGENVMSFEISGTLNRKDFGLLWNTPIPNGGMMISDEVKLDIMTEFKEVK